MIAVPPVVLVGACASLDPSDDYRKAGELVEARTGEPAPAWPNGADSTAIWDGTSPLSADAAVRVALAANPALLARAQAIAGARADVAQAGLLPNPVLGLTLGFPGGGEENITSVSISLVQQLAALWTRGDRIAAAEGDLDAEILDLSDAALELATQVRLAHARAASAEHVAGLTREHAGLLEQLVGVAQQRVDAGEGTRLDVTRLTLAMRSLEADLRSAELERLTARHELLALLGRADAPADFPLADDDTRLAPLPDERAAMDIAAAQRLDVALADAHRRAAHAELALARGEQIPEIEAGVEFSSDDDKRQEIGPTVGIEVPIFDTGAAGVARAQAQARAADLAARAARQKAFAEARVALARATAADDLAAFTREQVLSLSDETLELARAEVAAGQADTTVLLDAQSEQIQARLGLARAELRSAEARITLARALGGRLGSVATALAEPPHAEALNPPPPPASSR